VLVPGQLTAAGSHRVYDETTAYLITDILKDPAARRPAFGSNFRFPFGCAVKTGTTKDYKDNWTIGYTTRYTVGVWVGNFDGQQMRQVSGVSGAGPIFSDIMMFLHTPPYGHLPTRLCEKKLDEWFPEGHEPKDSCGVHEEFRFRLPDGTERQKTFAIFPAEYREWAHQEGIPLPPPGARRVSRNGNADMKIDRLMIVSPNTGDYFKIDPVLRREYQTSTFASASTAGKSNLLRRQAYGGSCSGACTGFSLWRTHSGRRW
jgi:penicillin-binding protein 1C